MKRRLISLALFAHMILLLMLSACSGGSEWGDDVLVLTAISSYNFTDTQWGKDPVSQEITKRTNVALDIEYAGTDFNRRIEEMRRTGEYPDLILSADMLLVTSLIKEGKALSFDGYLEKSGENIKKYFNSERLFGRDMLDKMRKSDGKIYGFNKAFGSLSTSYDWYFQIQYRVLEEFGYPRIETLDELGALLERYVEKYPEYSKNALLLPISERTIRHSIGNAAMRAAGNQDDGEYYVDPETHEVTYAMTTNASHDYLKWLNEMNTKGLLSSASFGCGHDDVMKQVEKGDVLCVVEPDWVIQGSENMLRVTGQEDRCYAKLPVYLDGVDPAASRVTYSDTGGSWPTVITTNCKEPERAMDFFDFMWSDEGQVLSNWGIEGLHYTVDENGRRALKDRMIWDYMNDSRFRFNTGVLLYDHWQAGALLKDSSGQYYNPYSALLETQYVEKDYEVMDRYSKGARSWAELWPEPQYSEWGLLWKLDIPSGDGDVAYEKISTEINFRYVRDMIMAGNSLQFESLWLEYKDKCYSESVTGVQSGIGKKESDIEAYLQNLLGGV